MSQADEEEPFLPPEEEAELLALLEAALRPSELDPELNERLLEMALEDPFAAPSAEELVESARLRDALAGQSPHEDLAVLRALGAPFTNADEKGVTERALQNTLSPKKPRSNVVYALFGGASALLAAAAAVALFIGSPEPRRTAAVMAPAAVPTFIAPHSTTDLFEERFETASTTARMDLIASARGRELRDNRYASWGVP